MAEVGEEMGEFRGETSRRGRLCLANLCAHTESLLTERVLVPLHLPALHYITIRVETSTSGFTHSAASDSQVDTI